MSPRGAGGGKPPPAPQYRPFEKLPTELLRAVAPGPLDPSLDVRPMPDETFDALMGGERSRALARKSAPAVPSVIPLSAPRITLPPTKTSAALHWPHSSPAPRLSVGPPSTGLELEYEFDDADGVVGWRRGESEGLVARLRRGKVRISARLDLHGMNVNEARRAVTTFIESRRERGDRAVLIVHGKGAHSPGGQGILRTEVTRWLAYGSLSQDLICFATARPKHGGTGALYVMLRRLTQRSFLPPKDD